MHHAIGNQKIRDEEPGNAAGALFLSLVSAAQTPTVNVAIDASKTGAPISKYIYGQFLEHGGDIVNTGVWAELLADRKFFYPVTSKPPAEPPGPAWWRRVPRGSGRRSAETKWLRWTPRIRIPAITLR